MIVFVGGDSRAGWYARFWAEQEDKSTRSTNPTETEKGEQEKAIETQIEWMCEWD